MNDFLGKMTTKRFIEMLAERGLSPHWYKPPEQGLYVNVGKDDRLVGQYLESFILDLTEEQMAEELDKIAHPDYVWSIGNRSKIEQTQEQAESRCNRMSDRAFIVLDNCIHPEIETTWKGGLETTYQCLKCGKKIAINYYDMHTEEDLHNILYLTFGRSIDILVKANREGRRP